MRRKSELIKIFILVIYFCITVPVISADVDIKLDAANMSLEHIITVCVFVILIIAIVFRNGFAIKLGDKEVNIGGVYRLLARKDEDILLKESLHKFSEEIDHDINGELYDLVDGLNYQVEELALKEHCFFTFEKFISILKVELEKRVRRNNLKQKLAKSNRNKYVESMLRNVEAKYENLLAKVNQVRCDESYAQFTVIKEAVKNILYQFFDGANSIYIKGCQKKIERYNKEIGKFKTASARISSCDDPIKKNEGYIKDLER